MSSINYDIVGLRSCGIDLGATVSDLREIGGKNKILAESFQASSGGVTANNLTQAARLGLRTLWIGGLGNDEWANYLVDKFNKDGIYAMPIIKKSLSRLAKIT